MDSGPVEEEGSKPGLGATVVARVRAHAVRLLWLAAVVVLVTAVWIQLARTDGGIPQAYVVLALILLTLATPAAATVLERIEEFSAGGVSIRLGASSKTVEQRLEVRGAMSEQLEDEEAGGRFIKEFDADAGARQALILQGHLVERLRWLEHNLDLPEVAALGPVEKLERLRWNALLLPDETEVLVALAELTPVEAERNQDKNREALLDFVRVADKLTWQLRSIVFDRQVRQAFREAELRHIWRLFDWSPQPGGRWTPWFLAHVDGRDRAGERLETIIVAARVTPSKAGLDNVTRYLDRFRSEIPGGAGMVGYLVLRDSSPQLARASELSSERARIISFQQLRTMARTRLAPD